MTYLTTIDDIDSDFWAARAEIERTKNLDLTQPTNQYILDALTETWDEGLTMEAWVASACMAARRAK